LGAPVSCDEFNKQHSTANQRVWQDSFVIKPRPVTILSDLIERTKIAAHELDNAVARRFERMLITVAGGDTTSTESTLPFNALDGLLVSHSTVQLNL